jgi:Cupredoxin-like domain
MLEQRVRTRADPSGHQVVEIRIHRGYRPDSIRASAGIPLRIVFRREDDDACSERVVFSNPRLDHRLSATGATTIDLPAQPPGVIRFTCGMGRYRGHIQIVDDRRSAGGGRVHEKAVRGSGSLERVVVAASTSALLLLVVALVGDARVAVVAVGIGLLVAGVLWVHSSRRSTPAA